MSLSISNFSQFFLVRVFGLSALLVTVLASGMLLVPVAERENDRYLMALLDNKERLNESTGDARLILLGGSSLSWGVSARKITEELGIPTINLGVHAGISYQAQWHLYRPLLNPNRDILVISPEVGLVYNDTLLSETYCAAVLFLRQFSFHYLVCAPLNLYPMLRQFTGSQDPVYRRSGFNSYGDYVLHHGLPRPAKSFAFKSIETPNKSHYISRYNEFVSRIAKSGFQTLLIPPIRARSACGDDAPRYFDLYRSLSLHASSAFNREWPFCLQDEYFFNTDYHMTETGIDLKTQLFIEQLRKLLRQSPDQR